MHSRTLESLVAIGTARTVLLVAYSPDGDPLALVEISRDEAARLVSLPKAMGHVFEATVQPGGHVHIEAADVEGDPGCQLSA
jgi:hypothetical protein